MLNISFDSTLLDSLVLSSEGWLECKLSAESIAFFDSDMSVCMALDALVIGTTFPKLTKRESDDIELSIHLYSLHSF